MTGEITLSGKILPVGGIKEKVLAAHRNGLDKILLPEGNRKDMDDIPEEVMKAIEFSFAGDIMGALAVIFPPALLKAEKKGYSAKKAPAKKTTSSARKRART